MIVSGGGRWDITEEPLRQRRNAEQWTKRTDLADIARRAKAGADVLSVQRVRAEQVEAAEGSPAGLPMGGDRPQVGAEQPKKAAPLETPQRPPSGDPEADAERAALDIRTALVERHRKEWDVTRGMFYRAVQQGREATGFDAAKFAKISTEILHNIQSGERKAWGLDADLIDYDALTDDQLQELANGKMPR